MQEANKDGIRQRMADMVAFLQSEPEEVTEYSESLVRRIIEKIRCMITTLWWNSSPGLRLQ